MPFEAREALGGCGSLKVGGGVEVGPGVEGIRAWGLEEQAIEGFKREEGHSGSARDCTVGGETIGARADVRNRCR